MTPPNTTPLNEEDRLGEIKKIILESGVLDEHDKNVGGDLYSSKGNQELTADALAQYIAPNITKLIQTLEKKARDEENSRCVEIMKDLFAENFHYRLMCGEIKDPTGKIDVHKAFVEYQELEPERMKFARYIEQRLAQLEKGTE